MATSDSVLSEFFPRWLGLLLPAWACRSCGVLARKYMIALSFTYVSRIVCSGGADHEV